MDQLNNNNNNSTWDEVSQYMSDHELHAQNIDRMRIISTELLQLAHESQQQVYKLKDKQELKHHQLAQERDNLATELSQERDKNKELALKARSLEKQLDELQSKWTSLYEQLQSLDADMQETIGRRTKRSAGLHQ